MKVTEHELRARIVRLQSRNDSMDALLRRIKPCTLDSGFWSQSLSELCDDAQDLIEANARLEDNASFLL